MPFKDKEARKRYARLYYQAYRRANPEQTKATKKRYYQANPEQKKAEDKAYRGYHSERIKVSKKTYYQANAESIKARTRAYHHANYSERIKPRRRGYWQANAEHLNKIRKAYLETNPDRKLAAYCRNRIAMKLKNKNAQKAQGSVILLGCDIQWLVAWLEVQFRVGMTWDNYGPVWHVDHKRPCASFDLNDPDQQRICFHWTNLQPLFAEENLKKNSKWTSSNSDENSVKEAMMRL